MTLCPKNAIGTGRRCELRAGHPGRCSLDPRQAVPATSRPVPAAEPPSPAPEEDDPAEEPEP